VRDLTVKIVTWPCLPPTSRPPYQCCFAAKKNSDQQSLHRNNTEWREGVGRTFLSSFLCFHELNSRKTPQIVFVSSSLSKIVVQDCWHKCFDLREVVVSTLVGIFSTLRSTTLMTNWQSTVEPFKTQHQHPHFSHYPRYISYSTRWENLNFKKFYLKVAPYSFMTASALMMRAVVICARSHKIVGFSWYFMTSA